jgi:MFS family permease
MTRNYYFLLGGFFISTIGDWFYQLALPLLVYDLTRSALSMAVTYGLAYAPFLLLLPFGGVIADRVDRRRLLVFGDLSSAIIVGLLTLLVLVYSHSGWIIWVIYPLAFALAAVSPLYHPAFQSYVPCLVEDQQLPQANSWMQSAENMVVVLGPLTGGLVIAFIGSTSALFIDMLSFFASAVFIAVIRINVKQEALQPPSSSSLLEPLKEGFRYVWGRPILRYGSFLFLGTNFASTLIQATFIFFLASILHFNPFQIGLTFAFTGVGALGGAIIAPWLLKRFSAGHILLSTTIGAGVTTALLFFAQNVFTVGIPWAIVMALSTVNIVTWFTLRQQTVPSHLLGRVIATTRLIAFFSIPLAALVGGWLLATTQNMYLIIGIAALLRIVVGGLGFFTPLANKQVKMLEKVNLPSS